MITATDERNNLFLTGSGLNRGNRSNRRIVLYKERVISALVDIGVPMTIAELATIDMKHPITLGYHDKLSPIETARFMFNDICTHYRYDDGHWHYER